MSLQRLSQSLRPLCWSCAHCPSLLVPSPTITASHPAARHYTASASHQRKFIRESPAARKVNSGYGKILPQGIPEAVWWENYRKVKDSFENSYMQFYSDGQKTGLLDSTITPKVFLQIGRGLIDQVYNVDASADALKSIWKGDPGRVFEVAHTIWTKAPWETHLYRWALVATRDAGLIHTLGLEVISQIKKFGANLPASRAIETIRKIAYETDNPVALNIWAQVALIWGRMEEAMTIYQHLNKTIYPSLRKPRYNEDILFEGSFKAPWRGLFEIYHKAERFDEANEMLKVGALIYRDPQALVSYAFLRREKDDWEAYEQCLVASAVSGNGDACYRLGNYYYLISKGEIPSRDQRIAQKHRFRALVARCLGFFNRKKDWRHLALNWYEMASVHGISEGTRNLAVLMREDGHPLALELIELLRSDSKWWNNKNVIKLRQQWDSPKFKPTLPPAWLEL